MKGLLDRARGCLVAGAVGDALGYPVEFMKAEEIFRRYGEKGIAALELDFDAGACVVSDDTQMTLFTANGLLLSAAQGKRPVEGWIYTAYLDWLHTQFDSPRAEQKCWLLDIPELYALRAPGNTCLSALRSGEMGTTEEPINTSKGCGGIMRVAPVAVHGFAMGWDEEKIVRLGAEAAAITHGHSLGWLSAAALVDIIYHIFGGCTPREAVLKSIDALPRFWPDNGWVARLLDGMRRALALAEAGGDDVENIHQLGGGWVGDEALFIGIYCAVRYAEDFDRAMIASVNHNGDSDSTGAVTGNILGAYVGYEGIAKRWTIILEFHSLILGISDDLCLLPEDRAELWLKRYANR